MWPPVECPEKFGSRRPTRGGSSCNNAARSVESGVFVAPDRSESILARWEERPVFLFSRLAQRPRASCCSARRCLVTDPGFWPRFLSDDANYDGLEAHRARQGLETSDIATDFKTRCLERRCPRRGPPTEPVTTPTTPAETSSTSLLPTAVTEPATASGYWPDFRGSLRDGRYRETPILTSWPREGLRLLWKQPIGLGYASFVIADGRAFTIEQRREQGGSDGVRGRDRTGTLGAWAGTPEFVEFQGGNGPRATPTYHEGRIYALGALGELRALDAASGALQWRRKHPHRQRRIESGLGHVGCPARRRRKGDRSAGRPEGTIGCGLRRVDRRRGLDVARRSPGLHLANDGHARGCLPDPRP